MFRAGEELTTKEWGNSHKAVIGLKTDGSGLTEPSGFVTPSPAPMITILESFPSIVSIAVNLYSVGLEGVQNLAYDANFGMNGYFALQVYAGSNTPDYVPTEVCINKVDEYGLPVSGCTFELSKQDSHDHYFGILSFHCQHCRKLILCRVDLKIIGWYTCLYNPVGTRFFSSGDGSKGSWEDL